MLSVAVRALIPVMVALCFAWARRHVPVEHRVQSNSYTAVDAAGWTGRFTAAQIAFGLCFTFGTFFLCKALNRHFATTHGTPELLLAADTYTFLIVPFAGVVTLTWETTYRIWRFLNAEAADAYIAYSDAKVGFGATRLVRWMAVFLGLPAAVCAVLCMPIHASFYEDGLWLGRFAQFSPEFHPYASVRSYELVDGDIIRDGSFQARPRLVLTFQDGQSWDSFHTREDRTVDPELIAYLTKKLRHTPEHLHTSPE